MLKTIKHEKIIKSFAYPNKNSEYFFPFGLISVGTDFWGHCMVVVMILVRISGFLTEVLGAFSMVDIIGLVSINIWLKLALMMVGMGLLNF